MKLIPDNMKLDRCGLLLVALLSISQVSAKENSQKVTEKSPTTTPKPLHEEDFHAILQKYTLIPDFEMQEPTREISDELFWKYNFKIPPISFPIKADIKEDKLDFIATPGDGREIEHLNLARKLFYDGKLEDAKKVLLSARARFGKNHPYHRRIDFYLGIVFLHIALQNPANAITQDLAERTNFNNAATFLSWALVLKKDIADEHIEKLTAKYYYRLALIYYKYERYAATYGIVTNALNFLRKTGQKDNRSMLLWLLAEMEIKNHTYLEAMTSLDKAIRTDPDPELAPALFSRIGDIYYNLNNYELAEDAYALGLKIAKDQNKIHPEELILRAESLFWMGKFAEAKQLFDYALDNKERMADNPISRENFALAALRSADCLVAIKKYADASVAYYKVSSYYPSNPAAVIAKIRRSCLELPDYQGNNISHARTLLDTMKSEVNLPEEAQELGYACYVASFTQRERSAQMVEKIRAFSYKHPQSRFLKAMVTPLKQFHRQKFYEYTNSGDYYSATAFYSENKARLFDKAEDDIYYQLFKAYFYIFQPEKAQLYHKYFDKLEPESDIKRLISAILAAELAASRKPSKGALEHNQALAAQFNKKKSWEIPYNVKIHQMLTRLITLRTSDPHLPWVYKLAESWQQQDQNLLCTLSYPLLSRLYDLSKDKEQVVVQIYGLINNVLEQKKPASCLAQLYELEMKSLIKFPDLLTSRYESRIINPLDAVTTSYFWQAANILIDAGNPTQGEKFLNHIISNAPKGSPEISYAQIQLDKTKNVSEHLWTR